MERFERHFVSQRIGRGIGAVEFGAAGDGMVEITALAAAERMIFSFTLSGDAQAREPTPALAEILLRTAISQAHKELASSTVQDNIDLSRPLGAAFPPWIGDLEIAPYGGATEGHIARVARIASAEGGAAAGVDAAAPHEGAGAA